MQKHKSNLRSLAVRRAVTAAILTAAIAAPAGAAPVGYDTLLTDFNFDTVAIGATPPTTFPGVDPYPQHQVYAIGGFPDTGPVTGTVTVQNVGGMSHAAQMTTTQGGTGSLYVDTQFESIGKRAAVSFDLNVVTTPTTGIPQSVPNAQNGQAFVIQAFGNNGASVDRAFRWVVTPTSGTGGIYGLRNNTDGDIVPVGTYTNGITDHVELDLDFRSHTLDAFIDNTHVADDFAFVAPVSNLAEYFIFQNGVEGQTNTVAFDNLVTYEDTPEPSSILILASGLFALGLRRKGARRSRLDCGASALTPPARPL